MFTGSLASSAASSGHSATIHYFVGVVAGLVRDHREAPGNFDAWVDDPGAGGALSLPSLDLTQRRAHILDTALGGLAWEQRRLLGWISVLPGSVEWAVLDAINPLSDRAQLDGVLKGLEQLGLLWWDRPSNTYDLHPIVRAYVHDGLADEDRVQANFRVSQHFEALPPEEPLAATRIDDLRQSITLFRALVGAGRVDRANSLWLRLGLGEALLLNLAACATVVELLTPISGALHVRSDLRTALGLLRRYDAAITQQTSILAHGLSIGVAAAHSVIASLHGLSGLLFEGTSRIAGARCLELARDLAVAAGERPWGVYYRSRAMHVAALDGHIELAEQLMSEAERRGPPPRGETWYSEAIKTARLRVSLGAAHLPRSRSSAPRRRSRSGRTDDTWPRCATN